MSEIRDKLEWAKSYFHQEQGGPWLLHCCLGKIHDIITQALAKLDEKPTRPDEPAQPEQAETKKFNCKHFVASSQAVPVPFGVGTCQEPLGDCAVESESEDCTIDCIDYEPAKPEPAGDIRERLKLSSWTNDELKSCIIAQHDLIAENDKHIKLLQECDDTSTRALSENAEAIEDLQARISELEGVLEFAKNNNPYPESVFTEPARTAFLEREKQLRKKRKWPNTRWYDDRDFCEVYNEALTIISTFQARIVEDTKQIDLIMKQCQSNGKSAADKTMEIDTLQADNARLEGALVKIQWHIDNDSEEKGSVIISTMLANIEAIMGRLDLKGE